VDYAVFMGVFEGVQQPAHDAHHVLQAKALLPREKVPQPAALNILHRDIGELLVLAVFVDADDRGMVEAARGERLVLESGNDLLREVFVDQLLAYGLQRDMALEVRVVSLVDDPHRPLADDFDDFVLAELLEIRH